MSGKKVRTEPNDIDTQIGQNDSKVSDLEEFALDDNALFRSTSNTVTVPISDRMMQDERELAIRLSECYFRKS